MLTISNAQLRAINDASLSAFLTRAQSFIAGQLQRTIQLADIATLYERGKSYELRSEQDFVRYMFVGIAVNAAAEPADPDWMRSILEVRTPANDLKLRRLFEEARHYVPPGMVPDAAR
jgi:hypothetical protein